MQKIYAWWPESYGEWVFVLATSEYEAKKALKKSKLKAGSSWDADYRNKFINECLQKKPDVIEPGETTFGEFA